MNTDEIPLITQIELARLYCERQQAEPMEILQKMEDQEKQYSPHGFALLECVALDSYELGSYWILPFGASNTFVTLEHISRAPISRNGMASNMSTVKAYALAKTRVSLQDGEGIQ